jgi:hypothetical protein
MKLADVQKQLRDLLINPRHALLVSAGLWLGSLALPALRADGKDMQGLLVLMIGWMGPATFTFAWYGNLFWLTGAIFMALGKSPPALVIMPGLFLAATSLLGVTVADDSGTYPATLMPGAYLWLMSFMAQLAATLAQPHRLPRSRA